MVIPNDVYVVAVSGDRYWTNEEIVRSELSTLPSNTLLIDGSCRGLDDLANKIATDLGFATIRCPAHWRHSDTRWTQVYGPCKPDCKETTGPKAGPIRNSLMLHTYQPAYLIAFHPDIRTSRGTRDCIKQCKALGTPGKLVGHSGEITERW